MTEIKSSLYALNMKVFLINLKRSPDRLLFMKSQLNALRLDYEIIEAIDGTDPDFPEFIRDIPLLPYETDWDGQKRELLNTEIACALSHQIVYNRMVEQGVPISLVLEDDVLLNPRIRDWILHFENSCPKLKDIEILNLMSDSPGKIVLPPLFRNSFLFSFLQMPNRAGAYFLTLSAARKLTKNFYPIRMPADDLLGRFELTGINGLGVFPEPARQGRLASTINLEGEMKKSFDFADWKRRITKVRGFSRLKKEIVNIKYE